TVGAHEQTSGRQDHDRVDDELLGRHEPPGAEVVVAAPDALRGAGQERRGSRGVLYEGARAAAARRDPADLAPVSRAVGRAVDAGAGGAVHDVGAALVEV